jgi:7-cyano-7-deazaguanine tRNA-ribosyltransferase
VLATCAARFHPRAPHDTPPATAVPHTHNDHQPCVSARRYVPVIHVSRVIGEYVSEIRSRRRLRAKPAIALGGIVPNLLRAPNALSYQTILENLTTVRRDFADKEIHVFGIGGVATLHLAALLQMDSIDSSGWRNRAARGIIQLPGNSERMRVKIDYCIMLR